MANVKAKRKETAHELYLAGHSQTDIARWLGVSPNTVSKWAVAGNWSDKRTEVRLFDSTAEDRVRQLIDYQLTALDKIKARHIEEDTWKLLDRGDIDALQKLFTTIKKGEAKRTDTIKTMKRFVEYAAELDPDQARWTAETAEMFIADEMK